jgi:hypothetical protein
MASRRLVYVLLNTPVGGRPYVEKIYKATPYLTEMYNANVNEYLSKRDLERIKVFPLPCGPRFKLFPYDMPTDFMTRWTEPTGPDIIDRMRDEYIQAYKAKQTDAESIDSDNRRPQ